MSALRNIILTGTVLFLVACHPYQRGAEVDGLKGSGAATQSSVSCAGAENAKPGRSCASHGPGCACSHDTKCSCDEMKKGKAKEGCSRAQIERQNCTRNEDNKKNCGCAGK